MLNVTLAVTGALTIAIDSTVWLSSGVVVARNHAQWYASDCRALHLFNASKCTQLHPASQLSESAGVDSVGEYTETMLNWTVHPSVPSITALEPLIITGVRRCVWL